MTRVESVSSWGWKGLVTCVPSPFSAWSKAAPISSSSTPLKMLFSAVGVSLDGAAAAASGSWSAATAPSASASGRRTWMTWPHFLQRTLTPRGPTFSSLIMYCARQLSQTKRIKDWRSL